MAEDAGLRAIGQDDAPALQTGANAEAVDDRGLCGRCADAIGSGVLQHGRSQFKPGRHAFERDRVDAAVVPGNDARGLGHVATAANAFNFNLGAEKAHGFSLTFLIEVYYENLFHGRIPFCAAGVQVPVRDEKAGLAGAKS